MVSEQTWGVVCLNLSDLKFVFSSMSNPLYDFNTHPDTRLHTPTRQHTHYPSSGLGTRGIPSPGVMDGWQGRLDGVC